ncbi:MAG TPA: hypothetical protein VIJ21_05800 [Solirubrobacterales bacterium]
MPEQKKQDQEREAALAEAVAVGKFPASRMPVYRELWEKAPTATAKLIAELAVGTPPDDRPPPITAEEAERLARQIVANRAWTGGTG